MGGLAVLGPFTAIIIHIVHSLNWRLDAQVFWDVHHCCLLSLGSSCQRCNRCRMRIVTEDGHMKFNIDSTFFNRHAARCSFCEGWVSEEPAALYKPSLLRISNTLWNFSTKLISSTPWFWENLEIPESPLNEADVDSEAPWVVSRLWTPRNPGKQQPKLSKHPTKISCSNPSSVKS